MFDTVGGGSDGTWEIRPFSSVADEPLALTDCTWFRSSSGGAPNDPRNLWPEPGASSNPKDELEGRLRSIVSDGELSLSAAQHEIAADWVGAYHRFTG